MLCRRSAREPITSVGRAGSEQRPLNSFVGRYARSKTPPHFASRSCIGLLLFGCQCWHAAWYVNSHTKDGWSSTPLLWMLVLLLCPILCAIMGIALVLARERMGSRLEADRLVRIVCWHCRSTSRWVVADRGSGLVMRGSGIIIGPTLKGVLLRSAPTESVKMARN